MNPLVTAAPTFPAWAGSVPLWALLAAVMVALIKVWPRIKEIDANSEAGIRREMHERISELKAECAQCHAEIAKVKNDAAAEISALRNEYEEAIRKLREEYETRIIQLQRQHAQEQISLVNTIIESVPAPELKALLKGLESVQSALRRAPEVRS